jgi:hypothetical protein
MATQALIAASLRLKGLFPFAVDTGAGRTGVDILNTEGFAIEVKARTGFDPGASMRQAASNARYGDTPIVVLRLNGQGSKNIGKWLAFTTWDEMTLLMAFKQFLLERPELHDELRAKYSLYMGNEMADDNEVQAS